jgi:pyruvate/2-oxoacid:ferredoxin oxidoreductase beta subunit
LLKLQRGEVALTESNFASYVKFNNLILSKNSTWFYAGDGAVYDIDSNGLDHIMAMGDSVKTVSYGSNGGTFFKDAK